NWVASAPDSLAARVELVRIEGRACNLTVAADHASHALSVHGTNPDALGDLFDAMIASEQYAHAQQIADRMLLGSALMRARGRLPVAVAAVFDGRFAAAYDSARRAIDANRGFGWQSELAQCLELVRSLAPLVGDEETRRSATRELMSLFSVLG